jgi:hypothetical protein
VVGISLISPLLSAHLIPFGFWRKPASSVCTFSSNTTITDVNYATYAGCSWVVNTAITVTMNTTQTLNIAGLTMNGTSVITHPACVTLPCPYVSLNVSGNALINTSAKIDVSAKGYLGGKVGTNSSTTGMTSGATTSGGSNPDSGGSHGGQGANRWQAAFPYDSTLQPTDYGSGGGGFYDGVSTTYAGGNGGGVVKLVVSGTLEIAGVINADGGSTATGADDVGGGGGGSIWISCGVLKSNSGSKILSALGGSGDVNANSFGGGGGRIAVYYTSLNGTMAFDSAHFKAGKGYGGTGGGSNALGGEGTFFAKSSAQTYGDLYILGDGTDTDIPTRVGVFGTAASNTTTVLTYTSSIDPSTDIWYLGRKLTTNELAGQTLIGNIGSSLTPTTYPIASNNSAANTITISSGNLTTSVGTKTFWAISNYENRFDNIYFTNVKINAPVLTAATNLSLTNSSLITNTLSAQNLTLTSASLVTDFMAQAWTVQWLNITGTNISLNDGKIESVSGHLGGRHIDNSSSDVGMSNGNTNTGAPKGAAGSHAGYGGRSAAVIPNTPYDSLLQPSLRGAGGGGNSTTCSGGDGGGRIYINITGTLNLGSSGYINAAGQSSNNNANDGTSCGAGAGGSIWITANVITTGHTGGNFYTVGGSNNFGTNGTGGGGGYVALYYGSLAGSMAINPDIIVTHGGSGYNVNTNMGGAGVYYTKANAATYGSVTFDNAMAVGNYLQTPFPQSGNMTFATINVTGNAVVKQLSSASSITASSTNVTEGSAVFYVPTNGAAGYGSWFVPGTVTLTSGGVISEY